MRRYLWSAAFALTITPAYAQMMDAPVHQAPVYYGEPIRSGARAAIPEKIESEGGGAIPALPVAVQNKAGVRYINGGIGDEEEAQLKSVEKEYGLQLLLTAPNGEYVSNVGLRVLDDKGREALKVDQAGPYVYADLPPGKYTVEAVRGSESRKMTVRVPKAGAARPQLRIGG